MKWELIAHYPIARGFSISPKTYKGFMVSFGRIAKQKRIPLPSKNRPPSEVASPPPR